MKHLSIRKQADKSKPGPPWPLKRVLVTEPPPLDHVMSRQYVEEAMAEGWMYIVDDVLEIRASNVTVRYRIIEGPGEYTDFMAPGGRRVEHRYTLQLISPR